MQQNVEDPLVEKILSDLHRAIKKYPEINEFEIIPSAEAQRNKSPVIHIGGHLGLESWCVKQMFTYILNTVIAIRKSRTKNFDPNRLDRLLLGGLLVNPDINTFWNMRRELVLELSLDIRYELHICKIIISNKPKSNESFIYREWCLQRILKNNNIDTNGQLNTIVFNELDIASRAIDKCANNYHATNFKLYIIRQIAPLLSNFELILKSELNRSEITVSKAVSDSSVYFYRQQVINHLKQIPVQLDEKYSNQLNIILKQNMSCNKDLDKMNVNDILIVLLGKPPCTKLPVIRLNCVLNVLKVLLYELSYISELNNLFPCHEAMWYHRRYVLYELIMIFYNFYDVNIEQNVNSVKNHESNTNNSNIIDLPLVSNVNINLHSKSSLSSDCIMLYKILIENERKEMECCSMDLAQRKLVDRHKNWLLLNFNLRI